MKASKSSKNNQHIFLAGPRSYFGCAILDNSHVFIVGGQDDEAKKGLKSCYVWNPFTNNWSSEGEITDLPECMCYCRAAVLDGYVYVLGNSSFYRCSLGSLVWSKRKRLLSLVRSLRWEKLTLSSNDTIATNQKISGGIGFEWVSSSATKCLYRIGGMADPNGMKRYNPSKDDWEDMPKLRLGRYHFSCVCTSGGMIYVMGGICSKFNNQALSSVEFLHLNDEKQTENQHGQWAFGPDVPVSTCYASATFFSQSDVIYLIGGKTSPPSKPRATCFVYFIHQNNGWQEHPISQCFAQHASLSLGNENEYMFVMGGVSDNYVSRDNIIFLYDDIDDFDQNEESFDFEESLDLGLKSFNSSAAIIEQKIIKVNDKRNPTLWKRICCIGPSKR